MFLHVYFCQKWPLSLHIENCIEEIRRVGAIETGTENSNFNALRFLS